MKSKFIVLTMILILAISFTGFAYAAATQDDKEINAETKSIESFSDDDYNSMIENMREKGYDDMVKLMESTDKDTMLKMHNSVHGSESSEGGMMEGNSSCH